MPKAPAKRIRRESPASIYRTYECDKCGSFRIMWKTIDHAFILCERCKEDMMPELKEAGYNLKEHLKILPRAMRIWAN
jgi:predicted nucleic acid-binding Zn ribbon protein